ncbi:MAG: rhodanese-like domain-containing protein [Candidatus Woesearchaeota archaeon]
MARKLFIFMSIILVVYVLLNTMLNITGMTILTEAKTDDQIMIDVRTREEHMDERIPGSLLIPHDQIRTRIESEAPDKDSEIYVYCRTGRRSSIAKRELESMGYTDVADIGGIIDWEGDTISGP